MAATKPRILCVDDDLSGLVIRALVLEKYGYDVLTATDGEQALRLFQNSEIDAVLIDYYMPLVDGAYVARAMRYLKPQVPIIMISAAGVLPQDALKDSDGFVIKGCPPAEINNLIEKVIHHVT